MYRPPDEFLGYKTFEAALNVQNSDDLRGQIKFLGIRTGAKKADRVAAILQYFSERDLRDVWNDMDPLIQYAISEAVYNYAFGKFESTKFLAKYGALPPRLTRRYLFGQEDHPMTLFDVLFPNGYLPQDLLSKFGEFVPEPAPVTMESYGQLPTPGSESDQNVETSETEAAALHDLITLLRLINTGKISISPSSGKATLTAARNICSLLQDGDFMPSDRMDKADAFMRPLAWTLMLQNAGLARGKGSKLELTTAGQKALAEPAHVTVKHVWKCWQEKSKFDEFCRISEIKGQKSKGRILTAVQPRRAAVVKGLKECPVGQWVDIDDFFQYFQATNFYFEIAHNPWKLYIAHPEYGSLGYEGYHSFAILQGRYIMALLWEYAATLGMLDIAHVGPDGARKDFYELWGADYLSSLSRYDGLKYFRITPLGAYCLGMAESYTPAPIVRKALFQVLPNQDIILINRDDLQGGDILFLDHIAQKKSDHTWALDRMRILDALAGGIGAEEIKNFLDANSNNPLPDTIEIFISDIARCASQVSYEGAAEVYHVTDEATALLIAHDTETKKLCYRAGKNRLIVPVAKANAFERALRRLGFVARQ